MISVERPKHKFYILENFSGLVEDRMTFWKWFQGWKRPKELDPRIVTAFRQVKRDIKTLLTDTNAQLAQQNEVLAHHTRLIHDHTARLDGLEEIVSASPTILTTTDSPTNRPNQPISRLSEPTNRLVATSRPTKLSTVESLERLDMDSITEQEKRIVGVFLDHRDMSLSYQDLAKVLDKSPYTVKNQMRQINMKTNLFDRIIDCHNRIRFKLKKRLKVEADLGAD